MRIIALLMIPTMLLATTPVCLGQGLSPQERLDLLKRVELLRDEADAILRILQAEPMVSAASTSPSIIDILTGLKTAIDNINLLIDDARGFLDTSGDTVTQIGDRIDVETKKLSDQMVSNLRMANSQITELLEDVQRFVNTSTETVDGLGARVDTEMIEISKRIILGLDEINDEIVKLVNDINALVKTTDQAVQGVGVRVDEELVKISDTIQQGLSSLTESMVNVTRSTQALVNATNSQIQVIGGRVDAELEEISAELMAGISELTVHVEELVKVTTEFIRETTLALRDIRIAAEETVSIIRDTDGKISLGIYAGNNGVNTKADVVLWHRRPDDEGAFGTFRIGATDIETDVQPEVLLGAALPPLSLEMGFIEQGIGIRAGYGQTAAEGPDARIQVFRFRDPRVDAELGYSLDVGLRGFLYADDILRSDDRELGAGLGFGVKF
jgi:ElaB/YqjD/DUF883 family membrane-anchored ribosome-binding protein